MRLFGIVDHIEGIRLATFWIFGSTSKSLTGSGSLRQLLPCDHQHSAQKRHQGGAVVTERRVPRFPVRRRLRRAKRRPNARTEPACVGLAGSEGANHEGVRLPPLGLPQLSPGLTSTYSIRMPVLPAHPGVERRQTKVALEALGHGDETLAPRLPELLVLEGIIEADAARVLQGGSEGDAVEAGPVDGAHAHRAW